MAILKRYDISGYSLIDSSYEAQKREPRHTHSLSSFSFVWRGSYLENCGKLTARRQPSTIIFHPPQEAHSVKYESEVRILKVEFDLKRLAELRENSTILDESSICRSEAGVWLGNRIYRELRQMDSFSSLAIEGLILELLAEASRSKRIGTEEKNIPPWLVKTKDFLHDNFTETLVLQDVAQVAGVHPVHLARTFRKKFGCTMGEYIRHLRLDFAARQVSRTDLPLGEIAYLAGFTDHSHFNRSFKSCYGVTPKQYRQTSR